MAPSKSRALSTKESKARPGQGIKTHSDTCDSEPREDTGNAQGASRDADFWTVVSSYDGKPVSLNDVLGRVILPALKADVHSVARMARLPSRTRNEPA
jgi:hypothetical protein